MRKGPFLQKIRNIGRVLCLKKKKKNFPSVIAMRQQSRGHESGQYTRDDIWIVECIPKNKMNRTVIATTKRFKTQNHCSASFEFDMVLIPSFLRVMIVSNTYSYSDVRFRFSLMHVN